MEALSSLTSPSACSSSTSSYCNSPIYVSHYGAQTWRYPRFHVDDLQPDLDDCTSQTAPSQDTALLMDIVQGSLNLLNHLSISASGPCSSLQPHSAATTAILLPSTTANNSRHVSFAAPWQSPYPAANNTSKVTKKSRPSNSKSHQWPNSPAAPAQQQQQGEGEALFESPAAPKTPDLMDAN